MAHPITATRPAVGCVRVTQACGTCGTEIPLEVASIAITRRRRLVVLAVAMVLSAIALPFEVVALDRPDPPLLALLLVVVLAGHASLFLFGVALIFSWGNHDGVRIPREDRFFRQGHPVLSAADHRYRVRRGNRRRV